MGGDHRREPGPLLLLSILCYAALGGATAVLVALKLLGVVACSWTVALSPVWLTAAVFAAGMAVIVAWAAVVTAVRRRRARRIVAQLLAGLPQGDRRT